MTKTIELLENEQFKLFNYPCEEILNNIENKSVQLICIDPPYNIKKSDWDDKWGKVKKRYFPKKEKFDDYYEWLSNIFEILSIKLKDNGSFFFFHNDFSLTIKPSKNPFLLETSNLLFQIINCLKIKFVFFWISSSNFAIILKSL